MNPKKQRVYGIIALMLAALMVLGSVAGILYTILA